MFTALKLLKPFLLPPTLLAIAFAIGIVLVWRGRRRAGLRVLMLACAAYVLLALPPVASFLAWTLERQYVGPIALEAHRDADAIVVLAGGADEAGGYRGVSELGGSSWRRLWRGIAVYRALDGAVPILYSGGSGDPFHPVSREAELARSYAIAAGVPDTAVRVESVSRTTYENGIAVAQLLRSEVPSGARAKVLLVTSAWHMPRAVAVFRKLEMTVIPTPADFSGGTVRVTPLDLFPSADAFASSVGSIHEWVGIAGYRVLGRL